MTPIEWRRALRENPKVSAHGWAVGCAVAEFWSPGNPVPYPSADTLAAVTRLNRKTVLSGVANLEACGLLRVDRKRGRASRYHLTNQSLSGTKVVRQADQSTSGTTPPRESDQSAQRTKVVRHRDQSATRTSPPQGQGCPPQGLPVVRQADQSGPPQGLEEETIEVDQEVGARARPPTDRFAQSLEPPAKPIPPDWVYPDPAIADAAREYGVTEADVRASLAEYVEYWHRDGGRKPSWPKHFRNHLRLQARRGRLLGAALVGTSRRQPKLKQPGATGSAFADTPPEFT